LYSLALTIWLIANNLSLVLNLLLVCSQKSPHRAVGSATRLSRCLAAEGLLPWDAKCVAHESSAMLEYVSNIMYEFDYAKTLSCIGQYRVELVLHSVTRSPHKYERWAAIVTMTT
jgi:hypothetical protein